MRFDELKALETAGRLDVRAVYTVDDILPIPMQFKAIRNDLLSHYATGGDYSMLYSDRVDYLANERLRIEGYCNWYGLILNSNNIYIGRDCDVLLIDGCNDVVAGDNNRLKMSGCKNVNIGNGNDLLLVDCNYLTIVNGNTLNINGTSKCKIGNDNVGLNIGNVNIIGSNNVDVSVNGGNNEISSNNISVTINGDHNKVSNVQYTSIDGSLNDIENSSSVNIENSNGNLFESSNTVSVFNTNKNKFRTDEMTISNSDYGCEFRNVDGVRAMKSIVQNRQTDNNGATLIMDEMRFVNEQKSGNNYQLIGGVWKKIE